MPSRKKRENRSPNLGWRGETGTPCQSAVRAEGFLRLPRRGQETRTEWLEVQRARPALFKRSGFGPDEIADELGLDEWELWDCLMKEIRGGRRAREKLLVSDEELREQEAAHRELSRPTQRERAEAEGWKLHRVSVWEKPGRPGVWSRSSKSVSKRAGVRLNAEDAMRTKKSTKNPVMRRKAPNPTLKNRRARNNASAFGAATLVMPGFGELRISGRERARLIDYPVLQVKRKNPSHPPDFTLFLTQAEQRKLANPRNVRIVLSPSSSTPRKNFRRRLPFV